MSKHVLKISVLVLIAGFLLGFLFAGFMSNSETAMDMTSGEEEDHDHDHSHDLAHSHSAHEHEKLAIDHYENIPTVDLIVEKDPKSGYNLQIVTENFEFAPEMASVEHEAGKGHAHLYVDGDKITRLYSEWYHIVELPQGEHDIMVTLNSNTHEDLTVSGEVISDTEIVVVE